MPDKLYDAAVMHVIHQFVAAMMAVSLLLVSTIPMVSAAVCDMPDTNMDMVAMQIEPVAPLIDLQDCFIECGCRVDSHFDGMPHQLAPHTPSQDESMQFSAVHPAVMMATAVLTARLSAFPTPPPRTI